jgi:hypothetical protein
MKLHEALKKTGVLKAGTTKAVYKNAAERPTEFQDDTVLAHTTAAPASDRTNQKFNKNLIYGSIFYATVIFLLLLSIEVEVWVHLLWVGWLVFIYLVSVRKITLSMTVVWWLMIFHMFLSFIVIGSLDTSNTTTPSTATNISESNRAPTTAEQQPATTSPQSGKEVYACLYDENSSIVVPSGYVARVYSSPYIDNTYGEPRQITPTSEFFLTDFTAEKELKETVYFDVYGSNNQFIPGVKIFIEVCNRKTNKATAVSELTGAYSSPTTDNTRGTELHMTFIDVPDDPGEYRVDGIMTLNDGEWMLVGRKNIQFK